MVIFGSVLLSVLLTNRTIDGELGYIAAESGEGGGLFGSMASTVTSNLPGAGGAAGRLGVLV